jgi:hypothetical protein
MCRSDIVSATAIGRSSFWMRKPDGIMPAWEDDWCRNLVLASVLIALIFLMLGSIYLASTRPTVPSTPETRTAPSRGTAFVQAPLEPSSVPSPLSAGSIADV